MDKDVFTYKLPEGWIEVKLEDVTKQITDGSHNPPKEKDSGIPMLSARNIENGKLSFEEVRYISEAEFEYENQRTKIEVGDVLLTIVATIGRSAYVSENINSKFTLQRSVAALKPLINGKFLMFSFQSPSFQKQLTDHAKGTAQRGVYLTTLRNLQIPLPPLNEQNRIVSKIEELFSELEHAEKALIKAQKQLEIYRQALLKSAFEGKLTKKWREGVSIETLNLKKDFNKSLPKNWKMTKIGVNSKFLGSGSTPKGGRNVYKNQGVPFIRSQNVHSNRFDQDELVYISKEINNRMARTQTKPKDVLLNITGASIGRCAFVPENFHIGNVNQHVCIIRVLHNKIFYKYLTFYLNSPKAQSQIKIINSGATREALTLSQIKDFEFPLCGYDEQYQIVQELETRITLVENLEYNIVSGLRKISTFKQTILRKSFIGKLVQQEPTDESASLLLEKIIKEKNEYSKEQILIKNKILKKLSNSTMVKSTLIETLKVKYKGKEFTFNDIRSLSSKSYEELKVEIFQLLDADKELELIFDKKSEKLFYKIKS